MQPLKVVGGEIVKARIPTMTARRIEHAADLRGVSVSEVIRQALLKAFGS